MDQLIAVAPAGSVKGSLAACETVSAFQDDAGVPWTPGRGVPGGI